MGIFTYLPDELLGTVESVDTSTVIIRVENDDKLRGLQVNHLISIQSSKVGQHLIGLVSKIIRKSAYSDSAADITPELGFNIIKVILIGTHFDRDGTNAREIAVLGVKGGKPTFHSEYDNGIYRHPICHDRRRFHPTQKPLALIEELIQKHSNEGGMWSWTAFRAQGRQHWLRINLEGTL